MSLIEKLTPEQEALIPVYREKWRKIALSTERIDREKAAEIVKAAYVAIDYEQPEILFQDSPYAACNWILKLSPQFVDSYLNKPNSLESLFSPSIFQELSRKLYEQLGKELYFRQLLKCFDGMADARLNHEIFHDLIEKFCPKGNEQLDDHSWLIEVELYNSFRLKNHGNWMDGNDFCISVLNIIHPQQ